MSNTWTTPAGKSYRLYDSMLAQPHLLIAGATGSGKSVILNGLIYEALYKAPCEAQLILCDPKRVELSRYKDLPHVLRLAKDTASIDAALREAYQIMMARFARMEQSGQVETDERDIYVIVDEFAKLVLRGADREENKLKKSIEASIEEIAELGRAAHVHLILATQAPNRQTLKANITLNLVSRVALHCDSAIESRQIIGRAGAELLPRYGELLYKTPETCGPVHYVNVPMIPAEEIAARVQWWADQKPQKTGFLRRLFKKTA